MSESQITCKAIKSENEHYLQCLFKAKPGNKYCTLHLSYDTVTDYVNKISEIETTNEKKVILPNPIYSTYNVIGMQQPSVPEIKNVATAKSTFAPKKMSQSKSLKEQKSAAVVNSYQTNENSLEVKMLIMLNDDEISEKIINLIGPVFDDITLSEDQEDPITMDKIWEYGKDGMKIPLFANKYHLFSYKDSKSKIRCLTIFTLYDMCQSGDITHPITTEPIPEADIIRAKELIDIYSTKLNLFGSGSDVNMSPEYELKNRINHLFKQFHIHSIFFEESWLTSITSKDQLVKVIHETEQLAKNNMRIIHADLTKLNFQNPFVSAPKKSAKKFIRSRDIKCKESEDETANPSDILTIKKYIVDMWNELIKVADNPNNQAPIWIIAYGLSFVVPEVKIKFPDLELMLQ